MEQTCFAAAFNAVRDVLVTKGNDFKDVVIGFMTDGEHTSKENWEQAQAKLVAVLPDLKCKAVIFHSVGFSRDHNFSFLNEIRRLGTREGTFSYAEPSDGPEALVNKLKQLFDIAALSSSETELTLIIPKEIGFGFVESFDSIAPPKQTLVRAGSYLLLCFD